MSATGSSCARALARGLLSAAIDGVVEAANEDATAAANVAAPSRSLPILPALVEASNSWPVPNSARHRCSGQLSRTMDPNLTSPMPRRGDADAHGAPFWQMREITTGWAHSARALRAAVRARPRALSRYALVQSGGAAGSGVATGGWRSPLAAAPTEGCAAGSGLGR